MMENLNEFRRALKFVLAHEGGYVNDPKDPGGETKWGISKKTYPSLDIKNLSPEQASEIYAKDYWDPCGCDTLGWPLSAVAFDSAVNLGPVRIIGWLRITPQPSAIDMLELRRQHYINICNKNTNLIKFSRGWWNRLADLRKLVDTPVTS
jgi:lysozyme family protein